VAKLFRVYSILILFIIFITPALALDLGISPPDINLKINRGDQYQGEFYLFGSEKESIQVKVYPMDWSLSTSGNYQFLPMGTIKRSASSWISFYPKNFSLPPKRGQKIGYTIKTPKNVSGSYWAALMAETNPVLGDDPGQVQVMMAGRVVYIIRIDINGSPTGVGKIERLKLNWVRESNRVEASLRIKNSGSSMLRFKGKLELKDQQGKAVGVVPFREGYILPDYTREFDLVDHSINLKPGFYIGLAIADFGERDLKAVQATLEIKP
jgi:hypothetical protein